MTRDLWADIAWRASQASERLHTANAATRDPEPARLAAGIDAALTLLSAALDEGEAWLAANPQKSPTP